MLFWDSIGLFYHRLTFDKAKQCMINMYKMRKTQSLFGLMRKRPRGQHSHAVHSDMFQVEKKTRKMFLCYIFDDNGVFNFKIKFSVCTNHFSSRLANFYP